MMTTPRTREGVTVRGRQVRTQGQGQGHAPQGPAEEVAAPAVRRRSDAGRRRLALVTRDDSGRTVDNTLAARLQLPDGACLTGIWSHLTPRRQAAWLAVVADEAARVAEAAERARARAKPRPMDVPRLQAAWQAHIDGTDRRAPMPTPSRTERLEMLDRLAAAGAAWDQAKTWALETGRWLAREVADVNPDVVDAYLEECPGDGEDGWSRFDVVFSDPEFWAELVEQCEAFGPQAPPEWAEVLGRLGESARDLLALMDAAGRSV